jgi:hypothetical protein
LIISACFIYLDWVKQDAVVSGNTKIADLKLQIVEFGKKKPAPVEDNLEMIKKDTALMKERALDLQRLFGKPYRNALFKFCDGMGVKENDLLAKFRDYCIANPKELDKFKLLEGFMKTLDQEKLPAAFKAFCVEAQKNMLEELRDSSAKEVFLHALGVPRTMSPTFCKDYIIKTQELFSNAYKPLVTPENVSRLTIIDYASRVPANDEIPTIIRKLQLFEDLFWRIRQAGIVKIESVSMLGSIMGDEIGKDFLRFSYRISVSGELDSIRKLVNLFQDAYKDNRVYSIKDIALTEVDDMVPKLEKTSVIGMPRVISTSRRTDNAQPGSKDEKELPPEARPDYGKPLVGADNTIQADIEFDYIIFVGDALKR